MKTLALQIVKNPVEEINERHARQCGIAKEAVENGIRIGELLIDEREHVKHGEWLPWLKANASFSQRTANNYMRLYANKDKLATVANLDEAYRLTLPNSKKKKTRKPATKSLTVRVPGNRQVTIQNALLSWRNIERANTENQAVVLCSKCWTYFAGSTPLGKDATRTWMFQCECNDSLVTAETDK